MKGFRDWSDADRFRAVLILSLPFFGFQFLAVWISGSLTLTSDLGHFFSHLVVMVIAYVSTRRQERFPKSRARARAALINWTLLIIIALGITFEAGRRWVSGPEVRPGAWLLAGAVVGLIGNLIALFILGARHDEYVGINRRLLWIHMGSDALGSVVAIIGAILMIWRQWFILDVIFSVGIAAWILYSAHKTVPEVFGHEEHS